VIAYVDSSVLARTYLPDEPGHAAAVALVENQDIGLITGTWTRIEVSGALVRAARAGRVANPPLALLDADLAPGGPVTVITAPQQEIEEVARTLVRSHGIRAMGAWHLAVAAFALPELAAADEELGFATTDLDQAAVASKLGLAPL
jgi:predicted nucleic acid-binding protein